ncbi:hypothetical protein K503DRAFT_50121 [Rhizopogon vinicolor AM-OR11-026]|uniref:Uncharacterized protein n=1 Tax=Rhizopogon vinicolor AM-OR11-026 TaxID=1314800 RepID=A0A1B7N4U3_9AGAM|nr:hypothetical protein K503DRAFT_50121 [Rhizopogon vinicolor AM-OR11-026]
MAQVLSRPDTNNHIPELCKKQVHCTFAGFSKVVRKDGLTRHVNETHLQVIMWGYTLCKAIPAPVFTTPQAPNFHHFIYFGIYSMPLFREIFFLLMLCSYDVTRTKSCLRRESD